MKLTCPGCGAIGSLELFTADVDAREFAQLMGRVPPELAKPLQRYLSRFRPRARALAWARGRKLLGELVGAIEAGAINRHGRDWPAPAATWVTAIEVILAKRETLQLPLKSHGYLLEIISGHADKAEAGGGRLQRGAHQRSGLRRRPGDPSRRLGTRPSPTTEHRRHRRAARRFPPSRAQPRDGDLGHHRPMGHRQRSDRGAGGLRRDRLPRRDRRLRGADE